MTLEGRNFDYMPEQVLIQFAVSKGDFMGHINQAIPSFRSWVVVGRSANSIVIESNDSHSISSNNFRPWAIVSPIDIPRSLYLDISEVPVVSA